MVVLLLLVGGRRFAGKDVVSDSVRRVLGGDSTTEESTGVFVTHFADRLKAMFAKAENLDAERLVGDREYKELHREKMTAFYHQVIRDSGKEVFADEICERLSEFTDRIFVVSDLRHGFELDRVRSNVAKMASLDVKLVSILVRATDDTRRARGWTPGAVDADSTESDSLLDEDTKFDLVFDNDVAGFDAVDTFVARDVAPLVD
jgi:phosphomevalonate kinase